MSLGKGAIQAVSTKQKINTRSSTESELVSVDDVISKVLWTKLFMEGQGINVEENLIFRDNQSSMKLELNGKASSGKRTRHFNIKYFFITDLIKRGEVSIEYCPTDAMLSDYMTKPLLGEKFKFFRNALMNLPEQPIGQQECVGNNDVNKGIHEEMGPVEVHSKSSKPVTYLQAALSKPVTPWPQTASKAGNATSVLVSE